MADKCCKNGLHDLCDIIRLKAGLEIVNDENRLRILCLLKGQRELCVCEIYEALSLPQNLASYHLNKLKEAGFLESRKEGVKVIYKRGRGAEVFFALIKIIN
ncbi:MAG: metalloregulator ArsR/SmtB family transcription factor [Planctomycetes bacterium]|jgi:ArsR family transcriptional regulator|nr:metalloregulator ArsR/SmtB family transcription factor [Planctomycetota bacterium]